MIGIKHVKWIKTCQKTFILKTFINKIKPNNTTKSTKLLKTRNNVANFDRPLSEPSGLTTMHNFIQTTTTHTKNITLVTNIQNYTT